MQLCAPGKFKRASREAADAAVGVLASQGILERESAVGRRVTQWLIVPKSVTPRSAQFNRQLWTSDGVSVTLRYHAPPDASPCVVGSVGFQGGGEHLQVAFAEALDRLRTVPPPPPSPPSKAGLRWRTPATHPPAQPLTVEDLRHQLTQPSGRHAPPSLGGTFATPPQSPPVDDISESSARGDDWCECVASTLVAVASWLRRR